MGRRGPAPQPTILRLVGGNASKRPFNAGEAIVPKGAIPPPPPAIMDEAATAEWERISQTLAVTGLACPIDAHLLWMWCVTWSRFLKAAEFVRLNGNQFPVRNKAGTAVIGMKEFPTAAEFRKLQERLLRIAQEIGMTPAARTRINAETGAGNSTRDEAALRKKFFGGA